MNGTVNIALPRGYWLNGVCYREAGLRPLTGADEVFLLETSQALLPAQRVTAVLARCLTHLGPLQPVTASTVQELTVGDREALLLQLRRLTCGDRLPCVVRCPYSDCAAPMDLELKVSDLLLPAYPSTQAYHEATIPGHETVYYVRFRMPTGADQEAAIRLAGTDAQAAVALLQRCVECVRAADAQPLEDIPPVVASQLAATMAELDPQAELLLQLTCPVCARPFSTLFDTAAYFFCEMTSRIRHLYREVHLLAWHYHWSEAAILAMTAPKRHLYLGLLAEALSAGRGR